MKKYEIGYQLFVLKDYARSYGLNQNKITYRPIQVNLWYPIELQSEGARETMLASNYLIVKSDLTKSLDEFTPEERYNILEESRKKLTIRGISFSKIDSLMEKKATAYLNAESSKESFPLVIFSPSMIIHSVSNIRFCEYLAGQGYIVASHASFGIEPNLMTTQYQDLDNQARDSEIILNHILNSEMKISRIGLIGHSWGAMASLLLASRNKNISSVVSLDGSEEWWKELIINSPSFEITNFQTPYLRLALSNNIDFGFFDALKSDKIQVEFTDSLLTHFSFVSSSKNRGKEEEAYYKIIVNSTLDFFNSTLKPERYGSEKFPYGIPKKYKSEKVSVKYKDRIDFLSKNELINKILLNQIDDVIETINESIASFSYNYLIEVGENILWTGRLPETMEKYFLNLTVSFPEHYQAYEMLGHVYSWLLKDKKKALAYYSKAFEISGEKRLEQTISELK